MKSGMLLVIAGPSAGAGKDTLLNMFLDKHSDWVQPPSTTTRKIRPGEVNGKDYNFISREEFKDLASSDKFLETDFHADNWYGTLREPVIDLLDQGKNIVLRKDVNGAISIKTKMPDAIIVFINAENFATLERRIRERHSESEEQIKQRLELAKKELTYIDKFEHVIINKTGQQEESLHQLEKIAGI